MSVVKRKTTTFHERTRKRRRGPTCIDLFSGAGGLAEGFRQAGWSVLAGNDADRHAGETFRINFPEASFFEGSIAHIEPAALLKDADLETGELDCLIGGPPCQSFSYNNHQRSATNARATLFRHYLRIVEALNPKTLVMENVPGMLTIGGGRIVTEIQRELGALGYDVEIRILYAEDFGVPQTRRRIFVVGSRIGPPWEVFPRGTHGPSVKPAVESNAFVHRWEPPRGRAALPFVTVGEAIGDLPRLTNGAGRHERRHSKRAKCAHQEAMRRGAKALYNHVCHDLTPALITRISHVSEGGNWRDIPRRLLTAGMLRAKKTCHTKRYGRLDRSGLASTLLTKCDPHWGAYVHPTQDRTISVREAARLQGFPDRFRFSGCHTHKQYEQVGNAVPVPVARALGRAAKRHLKAHHAKTTTAHASAERSRKRAA